MRNTYDVIVVGAGHAGSEAALIAAKKGMRVLVICTTLDSVGFLACNPSIGGNAKGQLASEIDALGGQMGKTADNCALSYRVLNESKGLAIRSLRAQVDKDKYHSFTKKQLQKKENISIEVGEVKEILTSGNNTRGVKLTSGEEFFAPAVVLACGVYLGSKTFIGDIVREEGPNGFLRSSYLTQSLEKLGVKTRRFATKTPPRIDAKSIDYDRVEIQDDKKVEYGFSTQKKVKDRKSIPCHITHTNKNTHEIILKNLSKSASFNGLMSGFAPRYCTSIESKIHRFPDKDRHQLFLEPETERNDDIYVQGLFTSMPVSVQQEILESIQGLEKSIIVKDGYGIEYDAIDSTQLQLSLEHKKIGGLFFAGQINGTSGYEEAAAQGLVAGINAANKIQGKEPLILKRSEAYIGVLIDDLVTKGTDEPYRMMTSRAEYRLTLRQNNANLRLFDIAALQGLLDEGAKKAMQKLKKELDKCEGLFLTKISHKTLEPNKRLAIKDLVKRSGVELEDIAKLDIFASIDSQALLEVFIRHKYSGYIKNEQEQIDALKKLENIKIPKDIDYNKMIGVKTEAKEKLQAVMPLTVGQASRISGVSPADISVLVMNLKLR